MAAITCPDGLYRPVVSLRLRGDIRAPSRSRLVLREVFRALRVADSPAGDGVTMASELVTNAVTHAPGPYVLRVCAYDGPPDPDGGVTRAVAGGWLMCEISDGGPAEPLFDRAAAAADGDPLASGGRGLRLVRLLSGGHCGVRPGGAGKAVWFGVPRD